MVALRFGNRVYIRKPRRWVRVPPVSWKYGRHSNRIGKPHCFNRFPVALNMLRPAFWGPTEPAWDFKITPLFVPKAIFGGAVGWRPVPRRSSPQNRLTKPIAATGGRSGDTLQVPDHPTRAGRTLPTRPFGANCEATGAAGS